MMRLGVLPQNLRLNRPIWLHAVSLGEAISLKWLLQELRKAYPDKKFVISTVTPAGNKIARSIAGREDLVTYLPLDFSFIARNVINTINPSLFIVAETEIWPNLIARLYRKKIPIITVNGRISDKSFRGYMSIKFLIKPILNKINLFCMQTEVDAEKLAALGVLPDKVKVTGNLKFDNLPQIKDIANYRVKLGLKESERLLIAGSTHPGEEEIILGVYKKLLPEFPGFRLLIAPRHPEQAYKIAGLAERFGFSAQHISQLNESRAEQSEASPKGASQRANEPTIFILDTIGELLNFYAIADIVFMGGSLIKKGGHNILEPAALGKPVLFGPHMFNFRDIAALFLRERAAIPVHNPDELYLKIKFLLNNASEASDMAARAKNLILKNQGATKRILSIIKNVYP